MERYRLRETAEMRAAGLSARTYGRRYVAEVEGPRPADGKVWRVLSEKEYKRARVIPAVAVYDSGMCMTR